MRKQRVGVLFGGVSSEHDVSLESAQSVIDNIPKDKYEVAMFGITKAGEWKLYRGDTARLPGGRWESDPANLRAMIVPDASVHGALVIRPDGVAETMRLDVVFPVLHGMGGEDGTVQGLLTLAGIPYVGCGVAASAICMDKVLTNNMLDAAGIPQAKWEWAAVRDFEKDGTAIIERIERRLGYPVFVKPANAGSSVGISKAADRAALYKAIDAAAKYDRKIVFEEAVKGHEIECAVLGGREPVASVVGEIRPAAEFYDYDAKYITGDTRLDIPARLPQELTDRIRDTAVKTFRLLGCEGMTRMDFFVRESDGAVLVNEPNTIPGFTSISMYPKLFGASGVPYGELLDHLIRLGLER